MTDIGNDISLMRVEAMLANTAVPANFESAMQIIVDLKEYFARLNAVRTNAEPAVPGDRPKDASRYHELDV
jgi:hypothetical protein